MITPAMSASIGFDLTRLQSWCTLCTMTVATSRINMRLSATDDALIRRAAEAAGSSVTEFVLTASRLAAERKLAEQRLWRLDAAAWDELVDVLDSPVPRRDRAKVAALLARPVSHLSGLD